MDYILTILLSYLMLYKYVTLFIVMFFAGLMVPFPINSLVFAAGVFANQGYFSLSISFFVAVIGNVLGDFTGYTLTRIWRHRYVTKERLDGIPYITQLEKFLMTHAPITIIATRFLGIAGSAVNFLAGLAYMPKRKFLFYDIIGNVITTSLYLFGGYYLGAYSETVTDAMSLIGTLIALSFILGIVLKLVKKWRGMEANK